MAGRVRDCLTVQTGVIVTTVRLLLIEKGKPAV
jgi:hypothetical protein